jgi:hypothetical protein
LSFSILGQGVYFKNVAVELTAIPNEGLMFSHWERALSGNEITMSSAFNMDSVYIKAIFTPDTALSISDESKIQRIKVFPNPSLGSYSIEEDAQEILGYFGFDLIARKILEVTVSSSDDLNFTIQDSPGVYMLVVQYRDGSEADETVDRGFRLASPPPKNTQSQFHFQSVQPETSPVQKVLDPFY